MKNISIPAFIIAVATSALSGCNTDNSVTPPIDETEGRDISVTVVDYNPAPGQFINERPEAAPSSTYSEMLEKCNEALETGKLVSLGSFGGYITLRTSEPVKGRFMVLGNAISTSAEPGVVSISADGVTFYELRGEYYPDSKIETITYFRPEENSDNDRHIKYVIESTGETGYLRLQPNFHDHTYYPYWSDKQSISFTARLLPANGELGADGMYRLRPYAGYADSYPNSSKYAILNPSNAIDGEGNRIEIGPFSYIRVTTGVLQTNGELGEVSTEVAGVKVYSD